jgi:polysaccharide chain length determinant protein (PEP-CTERM system associated)
MQFQEALQELITYLRGIWRFRWYAMVIAWVVSIGGWIYIAKMPDQYESSAKVLVDTESMLRPLLHGLAVQSNVAQRVQLMTKTLLSRPNLEKVLRMTDMDHKAATVHDMDALINQIRDSVRLNGTRTQNLYTLSATNSDPNTAKNIVQSLITIFIEDALGNTRQDSDVAQKFLLEQIKEYESRLVKAENRIKEFKQKNIGQMPGVGRDYFEQLQTAQVELEQANLKLRELKKRKEELNRQLKGEEPVFGFGAPLPGSNLQSPLDERIRQLEEKVDDLLLVYTENHPTVIAARAALEELKKEREEDLKNSPQQTFDPSKELAQNPIYQQLKISKAQTEAEISALEVRVKEYSNRVDKYKKLVNTGPEIEAELQSLNRDYALNKDSYNMLVARLESAKLGEQAEQAGDEVKFEIIEPPRVPVKPSGPNRMLFSAAALFFGIAGGVGVGFLLSQLKPVIYDRRTLKSVSGYPVFGVVSRFWYPELLFRKRLEFGIFLAVGVILAMCFAGLLVLQQSEFGIAKYLGTIVQ